jgi:hypothetical protein
MVTLYNIIFYTITKGTVLSVPRGMGGVPHKIIYFMLMEILTPITFIILTFLSSFIHYKILFLKNIISILKIKIV